MSDVSDAEPSPKRSKVSEEEEDEETGTDEEEYEVTDTEEEEEESDEEDGPQCERCAEDFVIKDEIICYECNRQLVKWQQEVDEWAKKRGKRAEPIKEEADDDE